MKTALTFVPALRGLLGMCKSIPLTKALSLALNVAEAEAAQERLATAPHRIMMRDLQLSTLPSNSVWLKGCVVADEIPGSDALEVLAFYGPGSDRNILPELSLCGLDTVLEELVNDWKRGGE